MNPKMREFENDTHLKAELQRLISKWQVRTILETGTEYGGSANAFAAMHPVETVITIDLEQKFGTHDLHPHVHFYKGDSRRVLLNALIPPLTDPKLIFLDAHSSIETDECPLRHELQAVIDARLPEPPIIVIHDCKVPGKSFGFDTYKDGPICWEWVSDLIVRIYPGGYEKHYNEESSGSKRGCLFVEPVVWNPESRWKPSPEEEQRMAE